MSVAAADSVNPSASSANDLKALKREVDGHKNDSTADASFLGSDAAVSDCGCAMKKFLLEAETVYESASNLGLEAEPKQDHLEVRYETIDRDQLHAISPRKRATHIRRSSKKGVISKRDNEIEATPRQMINSDLKAIRDIDDKPVPGLPPINADETISPLYGGRNLDVWARLVSWYSLEEDPMEAGSRFKILARLMELISDRVEDFPDTAGVRKGEIPFMQEKLMEENELVKTVENELRLGQVRQAIESHYLSYANKEPLEEARSTGTPGTPLHSYQMAVAKADPLSLNSVELPPLNTIPKAGSPSAEPNPVARPLDIGAVQLNILEAGLMNAEINATEAEGHVSHPIHKDEAWLDNNSFRDANPTYALRPSLKAMSDASKTCGQTPYERKSERSHSQDQISDGAPLLDSVARPMGQKHAESATGGDLATDLSQFTTRKSWSIPDDGRDITIPVRRKKDTSEAQARESLLIEYFEGSNKSSRPHVRVKLSGSAARKIEDTDRSHKPTFTRHIPLGPCTPRKEPATESKVETITSKSRANIYEDGTKGRKSKDDENPGQYSDKPNGEYSLDHYDGPTTMDLVPKARLRSSRKRRFKRSEDHQFRAHNADVN